jgi:hypothetical protein
MSDYHIDENTSVQEALLMYIQMAKDLGVLSDKPEDELAFIDMLLGGDYSMLKDKNSC